MTKIGTEAFASNKIQELHIPNNVKTIGTEAFSSNQLDTLKIPNGITTLGTRAFGSNNLTDLNIPSGVTKLGGGVFLNNNFSKDNEFIYVRNSDGSIDYDVLDSCAVKDASDLTLPNEKTIDSNACRTVKFKNLIIPNSVKQIYSLAFSLNSAKTVTLSENLEIIGFQAFE